MKKVEELNIYYIQGAAVWCAVRSTVVIGPYFLKDDNGATVTGAFPKFKAEETSFG